MKKFKKIMLVLLIIIVSLAAIVYGGVFLGHKVIFPLKVSKVPTIEDITDGVFTLGPQAHSFQPATIDEYIPVLAEQVKRYNEIAPSLWPDNALVNQSVIAEGIESKRFWFIDPNGAVTPISKKDALGYGFNHLAYVGGFSFFEGGVYLAVTEEDLTNYLMWQKYLHLGTYDSVLFMTHEGFHAREQPKWQIMDDVPNPGRSDFAENTPARAKRSLLQKQLLKAVSEPGSIEPVLEALATYTDWKAQFPDDYKNSVYFDRIEGTANYFELITGLYCGYPDQVKTADDLDHALSLLATRDDVYVQHGLIKESYCAPAFACVLLERFDSGWKEKLMSESDATPIEMLYQRFKDETLPAPRIITQAEIDAVALEMQKPALNRGMPLLFKFFYDILY